MSRVIDAMHLGLDRVICVYEVDGVVVDPGPTVCLPTVLDALGGEPPRALLLTHVHLDHAGSAGSLVERYPDLPVYVHARGAPHVIDPSKLMRSAGRLYGDALGRYMGESLPVPERNVRVLEGGETVEGFRVEYTPGHAWHHVSFLHEATGDAYVGDVAGVTVPPFGFLAPPTPPPDIDLEAWRRSLDLVAAWDPRRVCITHFGPLDDVGASLDSVREGLSAWGQSAREDGEDAWVAALESHIRDVGGEEAYGRFFSALTPDVLYAGLDRYWRKRAERAGAAP